MSEQDTKYSKYTKLPLPKRQGGSTDQNPVGAGSAEQTPREPSGGGSSALLSFSHHGALANAKTAVEYWTNVVFDLQRESDSALSSGQSLDYPAWVERFSDAERSLKNAVEVFTLLSG